MSPVAIILAVAMPLIACSVNAWINITIKFASDAEQATSGVKLIILRIINWIMTLVLLAQLVREIMLPDPLTRLSMLVILLPMFGLFNSFISWWISRMFGQIFQLMKDHNNNLSTSLKSHLNVAEKLIERFPKLPEA